MIHFSTSLVSLRLYKLGFNSILVLEREFMTSKVAVAIVNKLVAELHSFHAALEENEAMKSSMLSSKVCAQMQGVVKKYQRLLAQFTGGIPADTTQCRLLTISNLFSQH